MPSSTPLILDDHGHLQDSNSWDTDAVFVSLCEAENLPPTAERLQLAILIRTFDEEYKIEPTQRALLNYLKRHSELALDSVAILQYFPKGLLRQGCKLAGLPLPKSCYNMIDNLRIN